MRSMQYQLGVLGTISAFVLDTGKTRKNCDEVASHGTFGILTSSHVLKCKTVT